MSHSTLEIPDTINWKFDIIGGVKIEGHFLFIKN